jgi:hypothetical protein
VYLTSVPFFGYASGQTSTRFWVLSIAGMVVFLGLYFWGYWIQGKKLLWIMAAIILLGMVSAPWNPGTSVYFIYAAAFAAYTSDVGFANFLCDLILNLPARFPARVFGGGGDAGLPVVGILLDSRIGCFSADRCD